MNRNISPLGDTAHTDSTSESVCESPKVNLHSSRLVRVICVVLACVCIFLACIGVLLPGIPTFDFIFLAVLFASKGSEKLHRWLYQNRFTKAILLQYRGGFKHISRSRKYLLTLSALVGTAFLMRAALHLHLKLTLLVVIVLAVLWVWSRAEKK